MRWFFRRGSTSKIIIAFLVVGAFLCNGIIGCGPKEEKSAPKPLERITIAVTPWPASAPIYVAHEKGYFRDEGLDMTLHSYISGHLGLDAVLTGKVDLATCGDTPIARAVIDGKPVAVVATISEVGEAIRIIARKDRVISRPNDLRGKKIGLAKGTTADFFLHTYLALAYIDPKDVRIVNVAADKLVDALLKGEVDAVSTWSPFTLVLRERLGSNAVIFDQPSLYIMTWNIAVTQQLAKSSPERIKKFLRAIVRANRFIREHSEEARTLSANHIGTDGPLYEREWSDYDFTAKLSQSLVLNLEDQARWMIKREVVSARRPPDFIDFIYTDALRAVQPGAVTIVGK